MNRRTHMRNAAVSALAILLIFLLAYQQIPAEAAPFEAPLAQGAVALQSGPTSVAPGSSGTYIFRVTNNSGSDRSFTINVTNIPTGMSVTYPNSNSISINNGNSGDIPVQVTVASTVTTGTSFQLTFTASSTTPSSLTVSTNFAVVTSGASPTPTATITATTGAPTATPTRGPVCRDGFEGDGDAGGAKVIDVNTAQERAICPSGDEDWLVFGGVHGKVYTIDVSRMDPGIDLSLELFDENLQSLAFNDDFYNRDPANPNPGDIKPRITYRIQTDGRYYIRVRDNAGRGGTNYIYVIALLDESYGPTPTNVAAVCRDLFEDDGLPEQGRLITSNELQEDRKLCPAGDADWVTFFGKTGKRYIIYTDTRRYRGRNVVNGETQAGADTVMLLTDRDGVSLIDFNDDIAGGDSLDSQIEFTPDVDGFYFIQVKNTGDIGNQFVRYDLVLLLCLPGQTDCGRASVPGTPVVPLTPAATGTPDQEFNLDPSATPTLTVAPSPRAGP